MDFAAVTYRLEEVLPARDRYCRGRSDSTYSDCFHLYKTFLINTDRVPDRRAHHKRPIHSQRYSHSDAAAADDLYLSVFAAHCAQTELSSLRRRNLSF